MKQSDFEKLVGEGMELIPEEFLAKLENVAVVIEDEPTEEQKKKLNLRKDHLLFGLYEGVPQIKRGPHYGMVLPDKITIFKKPIIEHAESDEEIRTRSPRQRRGSRNLDFSLRSKIKQIVKNTVWHEIAHHFGSSEESVRRAERKRRGR